MQAKFAVPLACLLLSPFAVRADDVKVSWYDPTCRFFVVELQPEFGLYELKDGPELAVGDAIGGDIAGGPDVDAVHVPSGSKLKLVHWGDAKSAEVLIRHTPDWCKSKRKKR